MSKPKQRRKSIELPYDFVPLSPVVFEPDWADQVSQDVPFQDGLSGELELTLVNETPLCVGGEQRKGKQGQTRVSFASDPEGTPYIPGTSLKGMLRSVMEIVALGRVHQVEDQLFAERELMKNSEYMSKKVPPEKVCAGFLLHDPTADFPWCIKPCQNFFRVPAQNIVKCENRNGGLIKKLSGGSAPERYKGFLGSAGPVLRRFSLDKPSTGKKTGRQKLARLDKNGEKSGWVVVTGSPSKSKKKEFIFLEGSEKSPLPISKEVWRAFEYVHRESEEWKHWMQHYNHLEAPGIPVFFHARGEQKKVASLGLASLYRVPYYHSVHELMPEVHRETTIRDVPSLIFGALEEKAGKPVNALRGRISISPAYTRKATRLRWIQGDEAPVLNSPKPMFFPAYIAQTGGRPKSYNDGKAVIAGVKQYPPRTFGIKNTISDVGRSNSAENMSIRSELQAAEPNQGWKARLRFHNLRPVELGALVWVISLGGHGKLRHTLGAARVFGMGRLKAGISASRLLPNDPQVTPQSLEHYMALFAARMEKTFAETMGSGTSWSDSPLMQQFRAVHSVQNTKGSYPDIATYQDMRKGKAVPRLPGHQANGRLRALSSNAGQTQSVHALLHENKATAQGESKKTGPQKRDNAEQGQPGH